jgi:hypothetical protein
MQQKNDFKNITRGFVNISLSDRGMDATRETKNDLKIIARHFLNTSPSCSGMNAAKE